MADDINVSIDESDNVNVSVSPSDSIQINVTETSFGTLQTSDTSTINLTFANNTLSADFVPTSNVSLASNKLVDVADPTSAQDAATKAYVDAQVSTENLWDRSGTTLSPHTIGDTIDVLGLIKSSRDGTPSQYLSMTAGTAAGPVIEANGANKQLTISNSSTGGIYFNTIGFGQALYINNSGATNVLLTTDSTSSSTGALIVSGGVGIGKSLYVGGSSGAAVSPTTIRLDTTFANSNTPTNQQLKLNLINVSSTEAYGFTVSANAGLWYHSGSSAGSTGYHAFATRGTERVRINESGNVGIGTASPVRKLHIHESNVATNGSPLIKVTTNISGATDGDGVAFGMDSANTGYIINYEAAPLTFLTNASEKMRITSDGNVGIGTTTPLHMLSVTNPSGAGTNVYVAQFASAAGANVPLVMYSDPSGSAIVNQTGSLTGAEYIYMTQSGNITFNTAGSERMRINSTGNVGIGNTSPSYTLDVTGQGRFVGQYLRQDSTGYSGGYYVNNASGDGYYAVSNATDALLSGSVAGDTLVRGSQKILFGIAGAGHASITSTGLNITSSTSSSSTTTGALVVSGGVGVAKEIRAGGLIFPQQATTAGAPAYVKGAIYFDTTLNKLRVGGATGWETVTSV